MNLPRRSSHRSPQHRGLTSGPALSLLLALGFVLARFGSAEVAVYHSPKDDGVPAKGPVSLAAGAIAELFLYIDGGADAGASPSSKSELCHSGKGSELCGWDIRLTPSGGTTFLGFVPDPERAIVHKLGPTRLRANSVDLTGPPAGPVRVGVLRLAATPGGKVSVDAARAVGASLQEIVIAPRVLAVPEPDGRLLQAAALLAASAAYRAGRRERRSLRATMRLAAAGNS